MKHEGKTIRGASNNPTNRFVKISAEPDPEWDPSQDPLPATQFFPDKSASLITTNDSPDLSFEASINPYRGCEHGCAYCYARPTHEYLGFSAGLDFESRIMVKHDAPAILRRELASLKWKPKLLAMSGVTDCYQPIERKLEITRGCLAVLAECRNPVGIVTKNALVTRDLDHLSELARHNAVIVLISITTLDLDLKKRLEPRTSPPRARLEALRTLRNAGIPAGVLVAPIIPAINDHEIPAILEAAAEAGAVCASRTILRLPLAVAPLFEKWLEEHFPDRKEKVLSQLRDFRGGKLNESNFGARMRGEGPAAERLTQLFKVSSRKVGISNTCPPLSIASFRRPLTDQLDLL